MTRSSINWRSIPGNLYANNTNIIYPSDNSLGIPLVHKQEFIPELLVPYGTEVRRGYKQVEGKTVHFFLDDYKFENLWNKSYLMSKPIQSLGRALAPDFSLYIDYPRTIQIFNVYRSRWLCRYWQELGIEVIPTVSWGDESTFDFCFLGIPKNSTVAIGTVGINNKENKKAFKLGFEKMIEVLEPSHLVVYGETKPVDFESYMNPNCVHYYESYWKARRRVINNGR